MTRIWSQVMKLEEEGDERAELRFSDKDEDHTIIAGLKQP